MNAETLTRQIQQVVLRSPLRLMKQICVQLDISADWPQVHGKVAPLLPSSDLGEVFAQVFASAQVLNHPPSQLAFALRSAAAVEEYHRHAEQVELVWTGPAPSRLALRWIDEALLQLISSARHTLTLMSFAVYPVERLSSALENAIQRGVVVRFFLELDTHKVAAPSFAAMNGAKAIHIYTWADEYRFRTTANKYGTLHAKAAVADGQCLLISSANLTEHAMSLNMELGLLITGGELPRKLDLLLDDFVERGVFVSIP